MNATKLSLIQNLQDSISHLEEELSKNILDGTPFLLCCDIATPTGICTKVHGHWETEGGVVIGWKTLEIIPNHLCGAVLSSDQAMDEKINRITERGVNPGISGTFYRLHRRVVLERRLEEARKLIKVLDSIAD